jgi:aminopeptidase N
MPWWRRGLAFLPRPGAPEGPEAAVEPLELRGVDLELRALELDGVALDAGAFVIEDDRLLVLQPPRRPFVLTSTVWLDPRANSSLEGLYVSGGMVTTQCEAEGFRRITYHPVRPDLLSRFRVRIEADRDSCPVLLSNGNGIEAGDLPPGTGGEARHYAVWDDPFPKPSYLFALVAGRLEEVRDTFVTADGRTVQLRLHVEPGDRQLLHHHDLRKGIGGDPGAAHPAGASHTWQNLKLIGQN